MEKHGNPSRHGVVDAIVSLVQGFLLGSYGQIPLSQEKNLADTMGREDLSFDNRTYWGRFLDHLRKDWPLLLGFLLGTVFIFLIPFRYLYSGYPLGIKAGLVLFALASVPIAVYRFIREKGSWLSGGIAIGIGLLFALSLCLLPKATASWWSDAKILVLLLALVAGFLTEITGIGLGTLLFSTGEFLCFADALNPICYFHGIKENLLPLFLLVFGLLIGHCGGYLLRLWKPLRKESAGFNAGFFLMSALYLAFTSLKPPYLTKIITSKLAQWTVLISIMIGFSAIGFLVTVHSFRFFNRREYDQVQKDDTAKQRSQALLEGLTDDNGEKNI